MTMQTALNFRTLDLNLLRVFDVVMAERNLTRAADRLAITQPAVSNALKRLRDSVGEDLLTRAPSGVKPTPRAEALWPEVRSALGHLQAALSPDAFDPQADATTFRIAMADATATMILPPLVSHIEHNQALANVRVMPLTTRDPSALLERGDADVAIGYFPATIAGLLSDNGQSPLHHTRLHESEYVCVMRAGHPLTKGTLTLDDFCAAQHLLVSFTGRAHGLVDQALAGLDRERRVVLTVNQYFTAGRVVANSNLLTVLPALYVESTGYRKQVVTRPLPFGLAGLNISMLWHQRNDRVSSHRWLRDRLVESARLP
jgi:DNA-binding transcriptional LysR family regulator